MVSSFAVAAWLGAGVALCWTAARTRSRWGDPGAGAFTLLVAALGVTSLLHVGTTVTRNAGVVAGALLWFVVPAFWALFVFDFTGRVDVRSSVRRALVVTPVIYMASAHLVLAVTASRVMGVPVWQFDFGTPMRLARALGGSSGTLVSLVNAGQFVGNLYVVGLLLVATVVLLAQLRDSQSLDVRLGAALSVGVVAPWVAQFAGLMLAASPDFGFESVHGPVAAAFLVSGVVFPLALERYDVFAGSPVAGSLGPDRVLEDMAEPVLVVDHQERVVRANPEARNTFEDDAVIGEPLAALVEEDVTSLRSIGKVTLPARNGKRHFEPSISEMRDRYGRSLGHTVVLRDVTGREVRQQRLQVLNRVLRHNLRNDVTTIRGRAELLTDGDGDPVDIGDAITDSAEDLVELGERAREIEQMLAVPPSADRTTDLAAVVEDVVDELRTVHAADVGVGVGVDVDVAIPDGAVVGVDERVLAPVVRNLVENAIAHNDAEEPWVRVSATVADGPLPVRLVVRDDGPGLPEHERAAVETGEEEPLRHGSGLGLWAVKWGVTRMGGSLSFADNEPRGTVVEVRLPGPADPPAPVDVDVDVADVVESS